MQPERPLPDGGVPQFVVAVTAVGKTYSNGGRDSSLSEWIEAVRVAADARLASKAIIVVTAIGGLVGWAISPLLAFLVVAVGVAALIIDRVRFARSRQVSVCYRMDSATGTAFETLSRGVGWLAASKGLWRINGEEKSTRPADTTSVTRASARAQSGPAANLITNIQIPSIDMGAETLLFLPDALIVRSGPSIIHYVQYESLRASSATMPFSERGGVPADSRTVGETWLYANKDGSPDRRRSGNRRIPRVEYERVVLSSSRSEWVLLVSNAEAARHFVMAIRAMAAAFTRSSVAPAAIAQTPIAVSPLSSTQSHVSGWPAVVSSGSTPPIAKEALLSQPAIQQGRIPSDNRRDLERRLVASIARTRELPEPARPRPQIGRPAATSPAELQKAEWLAEGRSATVHGFSTGDLVFVGERLTALSGYGVESSLIDPTLQVHASIANVTGTGMTYWPSYSRISPESRRAFLQWLDGGRADPDVHIGYVFIFFYGLERRVFEVLEAEGKETGELLSIAKELSRLLALHASRSGSFAGYAGELLNVITALEPAARELARTGPTHVASGVPYSLRVRLGELSAGAKPLPASIALEWVRAVSYLNTAATRCAAELELLFHIRYAHAFPKGLIIKPNKAFVDLTYRLAAANGPTLRIQMKDLPDVTQLTQPVAKLTKLVLECSASLDAYSRFLGKNASGRQSLAAFALLPDELVEATYSADAKALGSLVEARLDGEGRAQLAAAELLMYARLARPDKVSKSEALLLVQALEKLGYGVEPDVRLGGPAFSVDGQVVVFRRLPDCPSIASDDYEAAMLFVRLGAMVCMADGSVSSHEREVLERYIADRDLLTPGERQRLAAHVAWLLGSDLGTTGLRRRLESFTPEGRRAAGKLVVDVAATDGRVEPAELKMLEKVYALLDLPMSDLYRDVHAAQTTDEPLPVEEPAVAARRFAIPVKPSDATATGLDMSRVRRKIEETQQVSALLSGIFNEDEPAAIAPALTSDDGLAASNTLGSLDAAHSTLLRRLAERESWPREDVERLASELSLLTDGALETINDYAYATADEPLWEDGDPLAINSNVAMELIRS
jgi:uncharacterized tellurite resistance protein B-like protein